LGGLGGQIPNGSPCFNVPTYTFIQFDFMAKKLVSRFGTYHCSVKGGQAY